MAAFVAALAPYAGAIQTVGAIMSAVSLFGSGMAGSNAAKYNAQLAHRNAAMSRDQAGADAEVRARQTRGMIGEQRAAYGVNGVTLEGSAIDVLANTAALGELDRQRTLYHGEVRAMGFESEAALDTSRASTSETQGYFGAASALLTGASKITKRSSSGQSIKAYELGDYNLGTTAGLA